ncbi:MAG: glutathione synthase, partial [Actinomycetales bacterium]|nr:glutathione synthase [Actinomycetales bacterium]
LKPVDGFSGRGVFLLATGDLNLATIVETATEGGRRLVMAQPWLAGVAEGNKRLFVLDGQILGAAMRHLVPGDFRIRNPDGPAPVTERDRHVVERLRPMLRTHGLRLVGLDVIDDLLIEVNLTSVGALHKADALLGTTWCADVVERALTVPSW